MTTFQRLMTVYWCLLPLELVFTWLDTSRQRTAPVTGRRRSAARRQLGLVPAVALQYLVAFAAGLMLLARLPWLDGSQRVLGTVCCVALLVVAGSDARRAAEAWRESDLCRRPPHGSVVILEIGVDGRVIERGSARRPGGVVAWDEGAVRLAPATDADGAPPTTWPAETAAMVATEFGRHAGHPVRGFVPVLVERTARAQLHGRTMTQPP